MSRAMVGLMIMSLTATLGASQAVEGHEDEMPTFEIKSERYGESQSVRVMPPGIPSAARGGWYVFAAPGAFAGGTPTVQFGGGYEWFFTEKFAVDLEASLLSFAECFRSCDGYFLVSVNGAYHLLSTGSAGRWSPFITGGIGGAGGSDGGVGLVNFGAGVDYRFRDGLGLRLEVRDHVDTDFQTHNLSLRVGVVF